MSVNYKDLILSEDRTHFLYKEKQAFGRRFLHALKFHAEGRAPVSDASGWFHIDLEGQDAYTQRYTRAFGYYCGRASVIDDTEWFHIDVNGDRVYRETYHWCGNFQENICTVRGNEDTYFHIDQEGKQTYNENYKYAGDYKDGIACVRLADGMYRHIDRKGKYIHDKLFHDLGIFHKDIATARDEHGWHHIDKQAKALYSQRYLAIEPFYNGFAIVETFERKKCVINESGETIVAL